MEDRTLLATAGHDYLVRTGFQWENPSRITYSIAPDGVDWVSGPNVLNSRFDAKFGKGVWEREIARALATWQAVANINLVPVDDGPYRLNALGMAQGDPRFGDIRIGGAPIAANTDTLAHAYYPPPQGSTAGGDVELNMNIDYQIGKNFDVFSVVLHETGHSLGLQHPPSQGSIMRAVYGGVIDTLQAGDIEGIRQIYGARQLDMYQSKGFGLAPERPIDLTSVLTTSNISVADRASLTKIGDTAWFSFVAPSYATNGSWQVTASASNTSMLSPKVTVYNTAGSMLGQAADPSKWSNDVTVSLSSIVPGQRYYVAVTGATNDVFSVGAYSLIVRSSQSPGSSATPPVAPPPPQVAPPPVIPSPITPPPTVPAPDPPGTLYPPPIFVAPDRFELNNSIATATRLGRVMLTTIVGLTLPTADVDFFSFQAGAAGVYRISAVGGVVQILNNQGRVLAQGTDSVDVSAPRNSTLVVRVQAPGTAAVANYTLAIGQAPRVQTPRAPLPRVPVPRAPAPRPQPIPRAPLPRGPLPGVARPLARQSLGPTPVTQSILPNVPVWGTTLRREVV